MKKIKALLSSFLLGTWLLGGSLLSAQTFNLGSNGSYGAIATTTNSGLVTLTTPPDGIFHCTTIHIAQGSTLAFTRNQQNTPIYLLATGNVTVAGAISVIGANASQLLGGLGGPGGFDGGSPASAGGVPPGAGYGPGAGLPGIALNNHPGAAGGGAFSTRPATASTAQDGAIYGNPLLIPIVGGSGGAGNDGTSGTLSGGGGGGGAILIASNTRISLSGNGQRGVFAYGGSGSGGNGGSGGAIRLVAPVIDGDGELNVFGSNFGGDGGHGRIRIDTLDRRNMNFAFNPASVVSIGSFLKVFPEVIPRLDIVSAAGRSIPLGSGPVFIDLPFGTPASQNVTVRAQNFSGQVPIDLVVTPENGTRTKYPATIDIQSSGTGTITVLVTIPTNTGVYLNAWTR